MDAQTAVGLFWLLPMLGLVIWMWLEVLKPLD